MVLSHVSVGSNNLPKAKAFYEAVFATIGFSKVFDHPSGGAMYGKDGKPQVGVFGPFDGKPATVGNGSMIALNVADRAAVDALYSKALASGGTCEGPPGERGDNRVYVAYFRDLDGNKFSAYSLAA